MLFGIEYINIITNKELKESSLKNEIFLSFSLEVDKLFKE